MTTKTSSTSEKKNPAAVALGRLGGKAPKSKPFGFAAMPKKRVKDLSAKGVAARKNGKRGRGLKKGS